MRSYFEDVRSCVVSHEVEVFSLNTGHRTSHVDGNFALKRYKMRLPLFRLVFRQCIAVVLDSEVLRNKLNLFIHSAFVCLYLCENKQYCRNG